MSKPLFQTPPPPPSPSGGMATHHRHLVSSAGAASHGHRHDPLIEIPDTSVHFQFGPVHSCAKPNVVLRTSLGAVCVLRLACTAPCGPAPPHCVRCFGRPCTLRLHFQSPPPTHTLVHPSHPSFHAASYLFLRAHRGRRSKAVLPPTAPFGAGSQLSPRPCPVSTHLNESHRVPTAGAAFLETFLPPSSSRPVQPGARHTAGA